MPVDISQITCTIDQNGIHVPEYATVQTYLKEQYRAIYGADVYLENDSQDGQWIGIQALAISNGNAACFAAYSAFSPSTAQGVGLSTVVKINGLSRKIPSYSTVDLDIVGQSGTTISGGIAIGADGAQWLLPPVINIPISGEITVTAVAKDPGEVGALPNTVTQIGTPTQGWQTVNNPTGAALGDPVESDAQLRQRQAISTMNPALTPFEATMGAVAGVLGVTRLKGYENDTDVTDVNGLPAHSISIVVEGGDATVIAQAIADKKTIGTVTYGTTTIPITDEYGVTRDINFYRPTAATIGVAMTITNTGGLTTDIETAIKQAMVDWINALEIGEDVEFAEMYVPANLNGDPVLRRTYKIVSLQIKKNAGAFGTSDLTIAFNEAPFAALANIAITVT